MAGIASIIGATAAVAGAGAGIAGAAGAGGGQLTSTQKKYNDWLAAQNYKYGNKQNQWMGAANKLALNPEYWAPYGGQRVADLTPDQQAAFDKVRQTAGGDSFLSGAQNQVSKTLNGDYLNYQTPTNQYMGKGPSTENQFIGQQPDVTNSFIGKFGDYSNPYEGMQPDTSNFYTGATTNVVNNPMLGLNNPYLNSAIDNAASDTIRNYSKAIAPSTDAAFARAGAFGGSAWGEQTGENQRNLADTLSKQATNARMGDYQTQQGLMNSNAQFQTGINQSDLSRNAGLAQNQINNNMSNWQNNAALNQNAAGLNQNTWQSNLGALQNQNSLSSNNWQANLGAQQAENSLANSQWATNAQLAQNQIDNNLRNYMAERGYQQDAIGQGMNLHNQGYTDANNLLQAGNQQQQQNQNNINAQMQYFKDWQNSGKAPIDWMLGNYQSAMGATAQPSMTQQTKTNPYTGALGGAIGGYQLGTGLYNTGVNNGWWGGSAGNAGGGFSNASGLGNGISSGGSSPWSFGSQFGGFLK